MASSQAAVLQAKGLYTFANNLSELPPGALLVADNVVIDRNGIIESRRGYSEYGLQLADSTARAEQLLTYKHVILRHYNSILEYDDGSGNFTAFDGAIDSVVPGLRLRSVEANGNLLFTSSNGIKKISATDATNFLSTAGYVRKAGAAKALDVTGTITYSSGGFLPDISKVAYRIRWAYKDANKNLIRGVPSSSLVLTNFSNNPTQNANVNLSFSIPVEITDANPEYFYQVYRTAVVQGVVLADLPDINPGDEMNLVIEGFPDSGQFSARLVTLTDITPDDFRSGGALLETNPVSGEGILQSPYPPPLASDIAVYQGTVFYANTSNLQSLSLAMLSTQALVSEASSITIDNGVTSTTYTFRGSPEDIEFEFDTQANTSDGGYYNINAASNVRLYTFYADKTGSAVVPVGSDTVGRQIIKVDISGATTEDDVALLFSNAMNATNDFLSVPTGGSTGAVVVLTNNFGNTTLATDGSDTPMGGVFSIFETSAGTGDNAGSQLVLLSGAPTAALRIDETARSLVNIINRQDNGAINAYYLSGEADVPGLMFFESRNLDDPAFHITCDDVTTTGIEFNPALPAADSLTVISTNTVEPNALYFSKYQEPEAVPIVNNFFVGSKDRPIRRVLALRDSLFIMKDDGVWRLTGQAGSFVLNAFDYSAIIKAPDTAAVLNNQIYMLSSQGVVTITDTGTSVMSRNIEDKILKLISSNYDFEFTSWGVAYESDRAYMLFVPSTTQDEIATQCFRYNTFTNAWTRFPFSKTCGVVNPFDDTLYLGAGDVGIIEKERKDFTRRDYADREYAIDLAAGTMNGTSIKLPNISRVDVGDVILQEQWVSNYEFNQICYMLESDPGVDLEVSFSLLMHQGSNLRVQIDLLATRLDNLGYLDGSYVVSQVGYTDAEGMQTDFNTLINMLNLESALTFHNYPTSVGFVDYESVILSLTRSTSTVVVANNLPWQIGAGILYKGIATDTVWAPQHFGDPSRLKQVREGTILFEDNVFTLGTWSYASDLSPQFESGTFEEPGIGDWGTFGWDSHNWGGQGSQVPLRTYIPRNKQRCRLLRPRFQHVAAREHFALFGVSFTLRPLSSRAYRE